jgi:hypothetical protein
MLRAKYSGSTFAFFAALAAFHALRAIAHRLNRTTVLVRRGTISDTHRPLAMPKRSEFSAGDTRGIGVIERAPFDESRSTFAVIARLVGGRQVALVTGLPTARHAEWLARAISASIGLE